MRRKLEPIAILAAGWALFLVYAYPGTLTFDSIDVLIQARERVYRDDHPPIFAAIWRLVEHVIPGPFGMLVLQSVPFLVGLYLIFRKTFQPRGAAIAAALVLLFPPVMTTMTAIWKDPLMAGFLVLGIACLLHRRPIVGVVLLTIAAAVRYNAPAATLAPIILLFDIGWTRWRRYALSIGIWLVTTLVAFGIDGALADRATHAWYQTIALYDIAGTLAHVEDPISDSELRPLLDGSGLLVDHDIHAAARRVFEQKNYLTVVTDPQHALWHFSLQNDDPPSEAFRTAIARTWLHLVTTYPAAYAKHRLATMDLVLDGGGGAVPWRGEAQKELRAGMHLPNGAAEFQVALHNKLTKLEAHTPLFMPWIYLFVSLIVLAIAWRERDLFALLASGLIYEAALLPLAATRDYRYSHWMITACCIAVVSLTARRSRAKVPA